jgi:hypothetical protein
LRCSNLPTSVDSVILNQYLSKVKNRSRLRPPESN